MKERPILFSAPMIRALLAGKKTQTRRLVKPQPERVPDWSCPGVDGLRFFGMTFAETLLDGRPPYPPELLERCPYGVPGDRLWVRETWAVKAIGLGYIDDLKSVHAYGGVPLAPGCWLRARGTDALVEYAAHPTSMEELARSPGFTSFRRDAPSRWRPSIFMPRWASRITLENAEVRVQRLHDISEADAEAEGVEFFDGMYDDVDLRRSARLAGCSHEDARAWFAWAWDHINGASAWERNPWVWAVSFPPATP